MVDVAMGELIFLGVLASLVVGAIAIDMWKSANRRFGENE